MDTGHWGYLFRKLGIIYPFPQNVHFSQEPIICPKIFILPNSQFAPSPHLLWCPFSPSALLSIIRCPYAPVPFCLKRPFTPNTPYPPKYPFASVLTCHNAHHFPLSPFAPVLICPKYPIVRDPNVWGPNVWTQIIRDHLSWCPFVLDPKARARIVRDPFS